MVILIERILLMRKFFLLLGLSLTANVSKSQTNVYHPFPEGNATWNVIYSLILCPAGPVSAEYTYYLSHDTIINSVNYHSVYMEGVIHQGACYTDGPLGYKGAIRQDTSLKKVFIILTGDTIERVLYDFNVSSIGDTLDMYCDMVCNHYHVTGIDSVLISGNYRRRIWYDCTQWINQSLWLIEGIGKSTGFLDACSEGFGVFTSLECFTQNNQTLYPDSTTLCNLINDVGSPVKYQDMLIYPNPTSGKFTLQSTNQSFNNSTITIYNSLGEIIFQSEIRNQESEIDLSSHPNGIYFVTVIEGDRMAVKKIIKL